MYSFTGNIWEKIAKKLCEIGSYLSKSPDVLDVQRGHWNFSILTKTGAKIIVSKTDFFFLVKLQDLKINKSVSFGNTFF